MKTCVWYHFQYFVWKFKCDLLFKAAPSYMVQYMYCTRYYMWLLYVQQQYFQLIILRHLIRVTLSHIIQYMYTVPGCCMYGTSKLYLQYDCKPGDKNQKLDLPLIPMEYCDKRFPFKLIRL